MMCYLLFGMRFMLKSIHYLRSVSFGVRLSENDGLVFSYRLIPIVRPMASSCSEISQMPIIVRTEIADILHQTFIAAGCVRLSRDCEKLHARKTGGLSVARG